MTAHSHTIVGISISCLVADFSTAYLGLGVAHRVALSFPSLISFWVRYEAPQVTTPQKTKVHLYPSIRGVCVACVHAYFTSWHY